MHLFITKYSNYSQISILSQRVIAPSCSPFRFLPDSIGSKWTYNPPVSPSVSPSSCFSSLLLNLNTTKARKTKKTGAGPSASQKQAGAGCMRTSAWKPLVTICVLMTLKFPKEVMPASAVSMVGSRTLGSSSATVAMQVTCTDPAEMSFRKSSQGWMEQGGPKADATALVKATICLMSAYCYALGEGSAGSWRVSWKRMFWLVTQAKPMSCWVQSQEEHLSGQSTQVRQLSAQGRHCPQTGLPQFFCRKYPGLHVKQYVQSWQVRQLSEQGMHLFFRRQFPAEQMAHFVASVQHLMQFSCSWQGRQSPSQGFRKQATGQIVQLVYELHLISGWQVRSSARRYPSQQTEHILGLNGEQSRQGQLQSGQHKAPTNLCPCRQEEQF